MLGLVSRGEQDNEDAIRAFEHKLSSKTVPREAERVYAVVRECWIRILEAREKQDPNPQRQHLPYVWPRTGCAVVQLLASLFQFLTGSYTGDLPRSTPTGIVGALFHVGQAGRGRNFHVDPQIEIMSPSMQHDADVHRGCCCV